MVPEYLSQYITNQDYGLYTSIDQASWRYIMRVSKDFFKHHAHAKYVSGLEQTGITIERIPRIEEMDEKLKKFGWRVASVTGFIPPSVFLEFLSLSVLPIACDMRRLEHLEYTPSPDIVHEAAGHAPMISDKKFASFLHKFGEIARKAIFAKEDIEVYEAVKHLSDIKEDPRTTEAEVKAAYKRLEHAQEQLTYVSEASELSRLGWWSSEYGLVKQGNEYKIYGAGLLSSAGEGYNAIMGHVKKVPLTIDCVKVNFDITKPQPQLFYVEDIDDLQIVIDQLAARMAYKMGGLEALQRAKKAQTVTTTVLNTGLQISGVLSNIVLEDQAQLPIYVQYSGPTQLAYNDLELNGHSAKYHNHGYGTPLGPIQSEKKVGENTRVEFLSGIVVEGEEKMPVQKDGKTLLRVFTNCQVSRGEEIFFKPEWGTFDMGCGDSVISVFGGAADRAAYLHATSGLQAKVKGQTSNETPENKPLIPLYQTVRDWREGVTKFTESELTKTMKILNEKFADDWLLRLEIYEYLQTVLKVDESQPALLEIKNGILRQLQALQKKSSVYSELITRGLNLLR